MSRQKKIANSPHGKGSSYLPGPASSAACSISLACRRPLGAPARHAHLGELAAFARPGRSVIVYHHADRSAAIEQQARSRPGDPAREVPLEPLAAVRSSRGTARRFLVAAQASRTRYRPTGSLTLPPARGNPSSRCSGPYPA